MILWEACFILLFIFKILDEDIFIRQRWSTEDDAAMAMLVDIKERWVLHEGFGQFSFFGVEWKYLLCIVADAWIVKFGIVSGFLIKDLTGADMHWHVSTEFRGFGYLVAEGNIQMFIAVVIRIRPG